MKLSSIISELNDYQARDRLDLWIPKFKRKIISDLIEAGIPECSIKVKSSKSLVFGYYTIQFHGQTIQRYFEAPVKSPLDGFPAQLVFKNSHIVGNSQVNTSTERVDLNDTNLISCMCNPILF